MTNMRTPAEKAALSAFIDAATSDADPGYPHGLPSSPGRRPPRPTEFSGATCTKGGRLSSSERKTSTC